MGKVLSAFTNGWPGSVSRSKDDVIRAMKNADTGPIAFGAPVFLDGANGGVINFAAATATGDAFTGFAVRVPDKSPDTHGSDLGQYNPGDPVDVLLRGNIILAVATSSARLGDKVYVRKNDGKLVTSAGAEGTTVPLPGAVVTNLRDTKGCVEVSLTKRNVI